MNIHSPLYQKAFQLYLRRGIPIELHLKTQERSTTHYIWRTRGDSKVRPSHAVNNGKILEWENPPPTGHPGEDYGCRCWAEPFIPRVNEYVMQSITSVVDEGLYRWKWYDFVAHFYLGGGTLVRLSNIGHLQDVINRAREKSINQVFEGVEKQVAREARRIAPGRLADTFANSYDFSAVSFIHGGSTIRGKYEGQVTLPPDKKFRRHCDPGASRGKQPSAPRLRRKKPISRPRRSS